MLEESLRYDATNRDAVSALAGLYGDAGRPAEAENLHLALLGARPTDPVVHNNYAAFLQRIGECNGDCLGHCANEEGSSWALRSCRMIEIHVCMNVCVELFLRA